MKFNWRFCRQCLAVTLPLFLLTSVKFSSQYLNLDNPSIALDNNDGTVLVAKFNPFGQLLLTASSNNAVSLWNLSGQRVAKLEGHRDIILRELQINKTPVILEGMEYRDSLLSPEFLEKDNR